MPTPGSFRGTVRDAPDLRARLARARRLRFGLVVELDGVLGHDSPIARDADLERDLDVAVDARHTVGRLGSGLREVLSPLGGHPPEPHSERTGRRTPLRA
jgi:hypothetical protein